MVRPSPLGVSVQCLSFYAFMFVVVLWLVFGVPRSSHVLFALVVLTEREWVGLFRECSIFEREEWYPEFGLAYDKLCWSQEWLSLVLAVSFLSWRHARHFPCSFLLGCACSAVVRACGRFARHVALWASTVSTFSTPCAFLSVYRLQFCELLFFLLSRDCLVFSFFPSPFGFRHFTKMWRRHGRFRGALFGLQAPPTTRATHAYFSRVHVAQDV